MNSLSVVLFTIVFMIATGCDKTDSTDHTDVLVFSANGDINPKMEEFRTLLGGLNTSPGSTGGRREIDWDGIPDSLLGKKLPADFFNPTTLNAPAARQRGIVYQSNDMTMVSKTNFSEVNTNAVSQFASFSGDKSFAVVNAGLWPVGFRVAGKTTVARIKGMGIVFSDVDLPNSTAIEFFNENLSLGKFFVPVHNSNTGFSFLGVYFENQVVTKIEVSHQGKLVDGEKDISQGGTKDLVIMDDFIYSEPVAK
jgi:hypothetical protein